VEDAMKDVTLICQKTREAWLLDLGPTLVGRDPACDVQVMSVEASRRHCLVMVDEDQGVTISDLGSANGTIVNGWRIHGTLELGSGDVVTVAGVRYQVRIHELASEAETLRMAVERHATRSARVA
jgi:pSer/pThr/pTyr-binding forkhead associated (FHA) protein